MRKDGKGGFEAWFDAVKDDRSFHRAELCSAGLSGYAGFLVSGFREGSLTWAAGLLVGSSVAAAWLENRSRPDWRPAIGTWLVAGLVAMMAVAMISGVSAEFSVLHLIPAVIAHVATVYTVRSAQRPVVVGFGIAALCCVAMALPATNLRSTPVVTVTASAKVLLDGAPVDPEQLAAKFHAGDSVTLELEDVAKGSRAREVANDVLVQLWDAGVRVKQ